MNIAELIRAGKPRGEAVAYKAAGTAKDATPAKAGAGVLFVTSDGKALLMRRSGAADYGGHWSLPGGHAEGAETPAETARREAEEETGRKPNGRMRHLGSTAGHGLEFHSFIEPTDQFQAVVTDEHDGAGWYPLNALPQPLHPGLKETLGADLSAGEVDGLKTLLGKWLDEEAAEPAHAEDAFEEGKHPRGEGGKFSAAEHRERGDYHKAQMEQADKEGDAAGWAAHKDAKFAHYEVADQIDAAKEYRDRSKMHAGRNRTTLSRSDAKSAETAEKRVAGLKDLAEGYSERAKTNKTASRSSAQDAACACHNVDKATGQCLDAPIALDRASARAYDKDGRLRVGANNISRATVNPYYGREIPGCEELGLDPNKIYQLFRDPEELAKAAKTFNNLPLLSSHRPVSAEDHEPGLVIGATGTDAVFEAPYLRNSIVVWMKDAIDAIESGAKAELSSAYHYVPVMEPGEFQGTHFDGRMTQIVGNHLALVSDGRAGKSVCVGDSATVSAWDLIEDAILGLRPLA